MLTGVFVPYKDPTKQRAAQRESQRKRRLDAIFILSDGTMRCKGCQIKWDDRVYQIDHVNPLIRESNGIKHGKKTGYHTVCEINKMYDALCNDVSSPNPKDYFQVLCANCHLMKTVTEIRKRAEQR
jgi:predicted HNH restriction endonuclease